jgi:hypothetical protein
MIFLAKIFEPIGALMKPRAVPHEQAECCSESEDSSTLLVRDTKGRYGQTIALEKGIEIEIGRYMGAPITSSRPRYELPNAAVSAKHAYVGMDDTGVYIIDVGTEGNGSRNGTFINGMRVQARRKSYLNPSDEIWLGKPHGPMSERLTMKADRAQSQVKIEFQTFAAR